MVTGDFGAYANAAALRAMLEFESQKHGVDISFHLADLERPPNRQFQKRVQVLCHGYGSKHDLNFPFKEGSISFKAQSYFMKGLVELSGLTNEVIGFVGDAYLHPVAHIEANRLYVYLNLLDLPVNTDAEDGQGINVLGKVFDFIFSNAMPVLKKNVDNYDYKAERERYVSIKLSALMAKETELARNISSNEREVQECMDSIVRLTRAVSTDRMMLDDLRARTERKKSEDAGREYLSILKLMPQPYKEITFDDQELKAYTHCIVIDYDDTEYEIGEFVVTISFSSGRLTIKNVSKAVDGYDHPHISNGSVCLGNISTGIGKMLGEFEFVGALTVLHEYLKSYNDSDAYKKIEHWGEGGYHDYESCINDSAPSDCLDCSDYDCPYHDDRFYRCYEGASTSDCVQCSMDNCSYRDDAIDNCHSDHTARECHDCQNVCGFQGDEEACYEDTDDGAECIGCSVTECSNYKEETEDEAKGDDNEEENQDTLTTILQEEA